MDTSSKAMQIGALSKRAGVSIDAVRFYERKGLLRKAPRTSGGFRAYTADDLGALEFVRGVQGLGFSLEEIREFIVLRRDGAHACATVRGLLAAKLKDVGAKYTALAKLRNELTAALRKCNAQIRSGKKRVAACNCPVLAELQTTKRRAVR